MIGSEILACEFLESQEGGFADFGVGILEQINDLDGQFLAVFHGRSKSGRPAEFGGFMMEIGFDGGVFHVRQPFSQSRPCFPLKIANCYWRERFGKTQPRRGLDKAEKKTIMTIVSDL